MRMWLLPIRIKYFLADYGNKMTHFVKYAKWLAQLIKYKAV